MRNAIATLAGFGMEPSWHHLIHGRYQVYPENLICGESVSPSRIAPDSWFERWNHMSRPTPIESSWTGLKRTYGDGGQLKSVRVRKSRIYLLLGTRTAGCLGGPPRRQKTSG